MIGEHDVFSPCIQAGIGIVGWPWWPLRFSAPGQMDVNDAIGERLGLLPLRRRSVNDAQMEQHSVGATEGRPVVTPPLASLEATASTDSGQLVEVIEGQLLEANVGLDEQATDGLRSHAQAGN